MKTIPLVSLRMVKEKRLSYVASPEADYNQPCLLPAQAVALIKPLVEDLYQEACFVIGYNTRMLPQIIHNVSSGSPNHSMFPLGNMLKALLLSNSTAAVILHNHPGGCLSASVADLNVTRNAFKTCQLVEIRLVDHIIITPDCTFLSLQSVNPELFYQ